MIDAEVGVVVEVKLIRQGRDSFQLQGVPSGYYYLIRVVPAVMRDSSEVLNTVKIDFVKHDYLIG